MGNPSKIRVDFSNLIFSVREKQVVLDSDLANIFGVETRILLQAVKRNIDRFPKEFSFHLNKDEYDSLRSQIVISKGRGGRRYLPRVFTEYGVIMAANVLNSKVAVGASVLIVKAFVRLRRMVFSIDELSKKIEKLEENDVFQDEQLRVIVDTLKKLMSLPDKSKGRIGFQSDE